MGNCCKKYSAVVSWAKEPWRRTLPCLRRKHSFVFPSVCSLTISGFLRQEKRFLSGSMNHLRSDFYNGRKVRNGHFDLALKEEVCSLLQENIIRTCGHCDNYPHVRTLWQYSNKGEDDAWKGNWKYLEILKEIRDKRICVFRFLGS